MNGLILGIALLWLVKLPAPVVYTLRLHYPDGADARLAIRALISTSQSKLGWFFPRRMKSCRARSITRPGRLIKANRIDLRRLALQLWPRTNCFNLHSALLNLGLGG